MRTELSDGTFAIRRYELGIEGAVYEAARESIRDIGPTMRIWREGATYEQAVKHVTESIQAWETGAWYDFAISPLYRTTFLGRVGLDQISADGRANIGYWVRTSQTSQGIATAAVRLITQFAFEDLNLLRLELHIAVDNLASRRVAEKVGARREEITPAVSRGEGEGRASSCCYAITRY